MATREQRNFQNWIDQREPVIKRALTETEKAVRHKCFISFHHADNDEVVQFIEKFEEIFIPRVLGVSDEDDFIDSQDTDYVMDQIRERYLTDSSVTIVLLGKCTWARRYVDWEVYSTLRNDKLNRRSGLLAITLPSAANYAERKLPPRVEDNVDGSAGYARWYKYPASSSSLKSMIETAFNSRIADSSLIDNTRPRKGYNSSCP